MNSQELDTILTQTLDDRKLSGGEKSTLIDYLAKLNPDDQQLGFIRHRAFAVARTAMNDPDAPRILDWLEEVNKVLAARKWEASSSEPSSIPSAAFFSPGDDCVVALRGLFAQVRRTCDICVFTITDNRVSGAILDAHKRGVKVRILTDNDKANDPGSDVDRLKEFGIPVRFDRSEYHMHHKFALFDDAHLVTGSYNWTRGAAEYNEDHFIVTGDPALVRRFRVAFDEMWERWGSPE